MAGLTIEGSEELERAFDKLSNVPKSVKEEILQQMGELLKGKVKQNGETMNVRDPESDVHVLDKLKLNSPTITDDGGSITITFDGTRRRGNKSTRNAAIAFINEYGRRDEDARPFVSTAVQQIQEKAVQRGLEVLDEWVKSISN